MKKSTGSSRVVLTDHEHIRTLASPVRQEIVDTLQALGAASVADLAVELGRTADGLYYHVRALEQVGLVVGSGHRGKGRRREAVYTLPAGRDGLHLAYDAEDAGNVGAVNAVVASMLRVTGRDFANGFRPGLAVCDGSRRNLWAARFKGWLSEQELEEANGLLNRLRELMDRPRGHPAQRLHSLCFVIAPMAGADPDDPH